jgi:hypothetical protein
MNERIGRGERKRRERTEEEKSIVYNNIII